MRSSSFFVTKLTRKFVAQKINCFVVVAMGKKCVNSRVGWRIYNFVSRGSCSVDNNQQVEQASSQRTFHGVNKPKYLQCYFAIGMHITVEGCIFLNVGLKLCCHIESEVKLSLQLTQLLPLWHLCCNVTRSVFWTHRNPNPKKKNHQN